MLSAPGPATRNTVPGFLATARRTYSVGGLKPTQANSSSFHFREYSIRCNPAALASDPRQAFGAWGRAATCKGMVQRRLPQAADIIIREQDGLGAPMRSGRCWRAA